MAPMKYSVFPCAGHSIFHLCHLSTESMKNIKFISVRGENQLSKGESKMIAVSSLDVVFLRNVC